MTDNVHAAVGRTIWYAGTIGTVAAGIVQSYDGIIIGAVAIFAGILMEGVSRRRLS